MRKFFKWFLVVSLSLFVLLVVALLTMTRMTGQGIRIFDGRFVGYNKHTEQWLFMDFPAAVGRIDGPYVLVEPQGRVAMNLVGDGKSVASVHKNAVASSVDVLVDDETGARFSVPLRDNYPRNAVRIPMPERLLAISDIEGQFQAFTALLRNNGVIDEQLQWQFGNGHLVLIGDLVDRGDNVVPTLWLIYKLEAEAQAAGGAVHYVLGNHEQYLLQGYAKSVADKYFGTFYATGMTQQELWSEQTELGRWLRSKPAMIQVGETLFVHGGISPEVLASKPTLEQIDAHVASHFVHHSGESDSAPDGWIHGRQALLFYRGLARDMTKYELGPKAEAEHVENVLQHFGAKHIAIGHTLAEHIGHDYDGRVLRVDVHHAGGNSEALLFADGSYWRVDGSGQRHALEPAQELSN